jgi:hypothetical protein
MKDRKEALPNPGDMFQSLRYLQDQASRGSFAGQTAAYVVLTYLVMNMWVRDSNPDGAGPGEVMYGRSAIATIAACTTLNRRTVQRALRWLADADWIDTQRSHDKSGREDRRYLLVRLDMAAHRERERLRAAGDALESITREGDTVTPWEGGMVSPS